MIGLIDEVLVAYPGLQYTLNPMGEGILEGGILVDKVFNDFPVYKMFFVKILLPKNIQIELPSIWETGQAIDKKYEHVNIDDSLCLAVNSEIRLDFLKGMTLLEWMDKYVETYFYTYIFFRKFGHYPFGERKHGYVGVLEFYAEHFEIEGLKNTWEFMNEITQSYYKGHRLCPCGSGKKVRACHGNQIREIYRTNEIDIIRDDVSSIRKRNITSK